jgi:hypothetical protein
VQKGDLSNRPSPRLVVVFEGAIGWFALPEHEQEFTKLAAKGKMALAVRWYTLDEAYLRKILDLAWRKNFNINLVTWLGDEAAVSIEDLMDKENIPIRGVFASSPQRLARDLPYNPDIIKVYDPDPKNTLLYGSWGVYLKSPNQIGNL